MSKESTLTRVQLNIDQIGEGLGRLREKLLFRLNTKGWGTMASSHEILGIIEEERKELTDAIQANDPAAIRHELLDVAVACVFGEICMAEETVDWPWTEEKDAV